MTHNASLDYARFLASFGIIVFHTGDTGASVGYAALPFFMLLLVVLAFPAAQRGSFTDFLTSRANRLLVPWAVWSVIYFALKVADATLSGKALSSEFTLTMVLTGPALHLWFLPFAFAMSLTVFPFARFADTSARRWGSILSLLGVVAVVLWAQSLWRFEIPVVQWLFVLPSALIGIVIGLAAAERGGHLRAGGFVVAVLTGCYLVGWTTGLAQLLLALGVFALCLRVKLPPTRASRWSAALALTIYLAHPMIAALLMRFAHLPNKSDALAVATCITTLVFAHGLWVVKTRVTAVWATQRGV